MKNYVDFKIRMYVLLYFTENLIIDMFDVRELFL